jgi:hypothetical protein
METKNKVIVGPISTDTTLTEHLLQAFADELRYLNGNTTVGNELLQEAFNFLDDSEKWEGDYIKDEYQGETDALVDDLAYTLDTYSPPFCYFGAHLGDGGPELVEGFGFWFDAEQLQHALCNSDGNDDGYRYLPDYNVWVDVNDHGNVTLFEDNNGQPGKEIIGVV